MDDHRFWQALDTLVSEHGLIIDRPEGTAHPQFPGMVYPLDCGYLRGTTTVDGGGGDVWRGSQASSRVIRMMCTVDLAKNDAEVRILVGCTPEEAQLVVTFLNEGVMSAVHVVRFGNAPG